MLPAWVQTVRAPLGYPDGGSTYDLDTMLLGIRSHEYSDKGVDQIWDAANAAACHEIHERAHWMQHHGTSFGALLSLLNFTRERAHEQLRQLSPDSRRCLFAARNRHGIPILPLEARAERSRVSCPSDQLQLDHLRLEYRALFGSVARLLRFSALPESADPASFALAFASAYQCLFESAKDAQTFFGGRLTNCRPCEWDGEALDTVDLLEGAAWLSEVWFVHRPSRGIARPASDLISTLRRRLDSPVYGSYTRPLRAYLKATGTDLSSVPEHIPTLAVIIDIALNPALPPFGGSFPGTFTWRDLYPPSRFLKLLSVLPRGHLLGTDIHSCDDTLAFESALLERSGLSRALEPHLAPPDAEPLGSADITLEVLQEKNYFDLVLWLQAELQCLRLVHPRLALSVPTLADHEKIVAWSVGRSRSHRFLRLLTPPYLVVDGGERLVASTLWQANKQGETLGLWLLAQSYMREITFEVLCGVGVPDLARKFPAAVLRELSCEDAFCKNILQETFGETPWD